VDDRQTEGCLILIWWILCFLSAVIYVVWFFQGFSLDPSARRQAGDPLTNIFFLAVAFLFAGGLLTVASIFRTRTVTVIALAVFVMEVTFAVVAHFQYLSA
jgi:hypothetical protein